MRIAGLGFGSLGALALLLAGCATTGGGSSGAASSGPPPAALQGGAPEAESAVASTYRPWPGVPTVITNVTIFDGKGGRIDGGAVRFENGKVAAIGQAVD
jgi:hypothetical protein